MIPVLETERLLIKFGTIEDRVRVHEFDFNYLQNIDGIFEFVKLDPNEVRGWFSNSIEKYYDYVIERKSYDFIVYLVDSMTLIGNIGFDRYDEKLNSLEIYCYLHPNYWGKGYAKEALIRCMEYLYNKGYENIIYSYDYNNNKSKTLCEKIGFEFLEKHKEGNFNGGISIMYKNIMSKERFNEIYVKKLGKIK